MKRALVTGANKSIGYETTRQLLQKGYYVYLGSRDIQNGEQAVARLKTEGLSNVEVIQIDVSDRQSIIDARNRINQKTESLDLLINNAGILGVIPQSPSTVSTENIREVFNTNLFGVIDVTQIFLDLLQKSVSPVIVNVTSGLASLTLHSDPSWIYFNYKGAAYGPSKTALNAYTIALAHELRNTPFRVNAVDPGHTATDFNRHQGTGNVSDAASFVVKYATIAADGPTGKYFSHDYAGEGDECPW